MAEWLRRWTRNPMGYSRAGSNPARSEWFWTLKWECAFYISPRKCSVTNIGHRIKMNLQLPSYFCVTWSKFLCLARWWAINNGFCGSSIESLWLCYVYVILTEMVERCKNWRCRGSNPGPFTCKANALPLSHIPMLPKMSAVGEIFSLFSLLPA